MPRTSKKNKTDQASFPRCFHVGIYARLSVDNGKLSGQGTWKNESIDTQIAIAEQYLKGHPEMELYGCYTDV